MENTTTQEAEEIRELIEARLRVRAPTLPRAVQKAGRLLPRRARKDAAYLVRATEMSLHPKLQHQLDPERVQSAYTALKLHLESIDPDQRRITRILSVLGAISFNLLLIAAALIALLIWRGYV